MAPTMRGAYALVEPHMHVHRSCEAIAQDLTDNLNLLMLEGALNTSVLHYRYPKTHHHHC